MRGVRGASSFEYLMVYALFMVIVAVAFTALSTFDVHRPQQFAASSCTSHSFACLETIAYDGGASGQGGFIFVLSNGLADPLLLLSLGPLNGAGECTNYQYRVDNTGEYETLDELNPPIILPGDDFALRANCSGFFKNNVISGDLEFAYRPTSGSFERLAKVNYRNIRIIEGTYS